MSLRSTWRYALLTPTGAGAIGVIRLSGPGALSTLRTCLRSSTGSTPAFRKSGLSRGVLLDGAEELDDVIVAFGRSAADFVADVFTHGGVRVVERILELFTNLGGERVGSAEINLFAWQTRTRIELEIMEHLVRAKTLGGVRFLAYQRRHLGAAIAAIEEKWKHDAAGARHDLKSISRNFANARRLLDGAVVAIVGRPNAGKSTLFNRLAGRTSAVVSDRAGTTRDWVTEEIELGGYPITLMDTAGQREGPCALEAAAIRAGRDAARNADLLLHVVDATANPDLAISSFALEQTQAVLIVLNKVDKIAKGRDLPELLSASGQIEFVVPVCAVDGRGTEELLRQVVHRLGFEDMCFSKPCLFTDRQMQLAQYVLSDSARSTADVRQVLPEIVGESSFCPAIEGI